MNFAKHYDLEGKHAPFSASQSHWLRYTDDKILSSITSMKAKERGTKLHAWAKETIDLRIEQPRLKETLYMYVNDAIAYEMDTEVVLYYSENFFGTADAISFRNNFLRVHDLKTGRTRVHMEQLLLYMAYFCLEYRVKPEDIDMEARIYQNNDILVHVPESEEILSLMDRVVYLDDIIKEYEYREMM